MDELDEVKQRNNTNRKLTIKLIITILLFLLAIAMLVLGIWAAQAGKDRFKGEYILTTTDLDAKVTAQVKGTRNTEDEGYGYEKIIWDSVNSLDNEDSASWDNIDLTFADKNSIIELVIKVENRKVATGISATFNAKLGDHLLDTTEREIGDTNIVGYIEAPIYIEGAIDTSTSYTATYKVVLKIANKNNSVKATKLEVNMMLNDVTTNN